jgi:hypothetical protein
VTTDLWDHPSHGVLRLSWYATASAPASCAGSTQPETVADTRPLAVDRRTTAGTGAGAGRPHPTCMPACGKAVSLRNGQFGRCDHRLSSSSAYPGEATETRMPVSVWSSEGGIPDPPAGPARIVSWAGAQPVDRATVRERHHTRPALLPAADSLWPELLERPTTTHRMDCDVRHVDNTPYADVCTVDGKIAMVVAARPARRSQLPPPCARNRNRRCTPVRKLSAPTSSWSYVRHRGSYQRTR